MSNTVIISTYEVQMTWYLLRNVPLPTEGFLVVSDCVEWMANNPVASAEMYMNVKERIDRWLKVPFIEEFKV